MQNDFPKAEKVEFEEVIGKKRSDALPHPNEVTFKLGTQQNITIAKPFTLKKIHFKNETHEKIADHILNRYYNTACEDLKYIPFYEFIDTFPFEDVLQVYRTLEMQNQINVGVKSTIERPKGRVWTKMEIFRLLDAVDKYGDDWQKVSLHVGRQKNECVLKFLKLDFEMNKLIVGNKEMGQLIFIAGRVHPKVAAVAAQEFISKRNAWEKIKEAAEEQKKLELEKVACLESIIEECSLIKLEMKLTDFKGMARSVENERNDIKENIREYKIEIQEILKTIKELNDVS